MRYALIGSLYLALATVSGGAPAVAGPVDDARLAYIDGDFEAALEVLLPAALAGDPNAQNIVGDAFDGGNGVERDHEKAREWWTKAADLGFSKAQYNLGRMLSAGRDGLSPDYELAQDYLTKAAAQGNGDALNELGLMHALGRGQTVDLPKAVEFYRRGAELGSRVSLSNLGAAYATGEGVEQDFAKSFQYTSEAAEMSDPQAVHNLGVLYRDGLHVQQNATVAFLLFQEATQLGYPKAAHQLADMMLIAESPRYDPVYALGLCLWAETAGTAAQRQDLFLQCEDVASSMTDAERDAGRALATALAE